MMKNKFTLFLVLTALVLTSCGPKVENYTFDESLEKSEMWSVKVKGEDVYVHPTHQPHVASFGVEEKGVKVVIDSRSFTLSDLVEAKPYLIKPNEEEIETYMGRHIGNADEAVLAAAELHALGIENVMISLGGEGAVIVSRDGTYYQKAPDIVPVSTIGAGDSSIAGFLMGLSIGEGIGGALKRAVAFGSGACLTPGTNPPTPDDVYVLMKEMN